MKTISKPIDESGHLFACEEVHISSVRRGDIVFHDGKARTVGKKSLRHNMFIGYTLFGDPYLLGTKPVVRFITRDGGKLISANNER